MRRWAFRALMSSILGLSLIGSACGSSGGGSPASSGSKGTLTIAGFNFPESNILANVYGGALHGILRTSERAIACPMAHNPVPKRETSTTVASPVRSR